MNRFFFWGVLLGLMAGLSLAGLKAQGKPSQADILYNISTQNFYQLQKVVAYEKAQTDLLLAISDRTKVKPEVTVPLTNKLQQELFNLDLKIKELNR